MSKTLLTIFLTFATCGSVLAAAQQIVTEVETQTTGSTVPESTVAILLGGVLWFLLLRKRA